MKTLVVYYSRTGSTKNAAEHIAKQLGADLDELIDSKNRMGLWGWLMAGRDALRKYTTTLMDIKKNPADYDLVIIGTPIWAGTITPAIRTYVIKYAGNPYLPVFWQTLLSPSLKSFVLSFAGSFTCNNG